ncbi:MAG: tyrosine-protein phosphatase, partial [Clostridia bacterium]|nr:tyrosine-protein phosphatase [Clostridia bacterium]
RNKAITGELSYLSCKSIHTFGNVACLQTVTGQQVLDALEWGARGLPDVEVGGFLHVSGLRYTVDTTIESTVQQDEKGVWIGGPTGEYRVKDVMVFDQEKNEFVPLDLEAEYNMAGYNYTLRDLGDGFAMFGGAVNVLDYVMEDYMVLANYIASFENGVVTGYEDVQDRITIIKGEEVVSDEPAPITVGGLDNNVWTTKYGNLFCDCKAETFINELGFNWADIVTVNINGQALELPVVPTYSYVDAGSPAIIVGQTETGAPTGYVSFAINMGNFTDAYGIATKETNEAGEWWWTAKEGVTFPLEITFELKDAGGYRAQYIMHELSRTNERADYADLTDEQFANFRAIATTGMGENKLFRSSSPINPELARNGYADAAIEAAGVKTIVNLADNEADAAAYEGYADTYYAGCRVVCLCLGVDFKAADFGEGVANGLRFMIANDGPFLIHCTEGKDRAGFVSAILECLMGASYQEVVTDYMTTYYNYYGIEEGSEKYNAIAESNIIASLKAAFGTDDLPKANLAECAYNYLLGVGMDAEEIDALKNVLK